MKTMTVRDLRLNWPAAERALTRVGEIIVTRDSKPVARILPYETRTRRELGRFDPAEHARRLRSFWRGRSPGPSTEELLRRNRDS